MKAIRVREFGGPEKMVLEEVADLTPAAGEVVVKVYAAGVNPVDAYMRTGTYVSKPSLPYTPGSDASGIVVAVGSGVQHKVGERVYVAGSLSGTYAEQTLCKESQVHLLPERVTFQQGAALGVPYATAFRAIFHKARIVPGETILINGASGTVGTAAVQFARAHGLTVIGTAGSEKGREMVHSQGAHFALDHSAADLAEQVQKITNGKGVNVVIEMLANKNLASDLQLLGKNGRLVIVGNRGTIEINPRDAMTRDAVIYGMTLFNVPEQDLASIHAGLRAGLEAGIASPIISKELPLAKASESHEAVFSSMNGKIVLIP